MELKRKGDMIIARVKVNRLPTPEEILIATCREQYVNTDLLSSMPRGEGSLVNIYFFPVTGEWVRDDEAAALYKGRRLKAVDPYSLCAFNAANPDFADIHPHATHWKLAGGMPREQHPLNVEAYATLGFYSVEGGGRWVNLQRNASDTFPEGSWLAGLPL
ncbi:MAG: hypothetical protein WCK46_02120 [Candidatus Adlerbacteria bacterium]